MGKSTLMKVFFMDIINKKAGIPILIELRRISKEKKILNEIHNQINSIAKEFNYDLLLELISEGGFIFILDGYDEISLIDKEAVSEDLQDFISKSSNNKFILTSRPESSLSSFGDFQQFTIEPLKKKEAFELLRKYDKQGNISSLLIKKLSEKEMNNIDEFLTNPLLVSLLFTAFEHKQVIPFKKYLFYRQVYDANFESHDLTKGESYIHEKYSGLEIDDFHRIMRYIGFHCLKVQKIEFIKDELLNIINESRQFCVGLHFNDSDFLKDILTTVPLFIQDGNYYKWAHKSLQEYFAAQFIYLDTKDKQTKILERIYNHHEIQSFSNLLDLYYDIDYKTFRNIILYKLLKEYHAFDSSAYKHIYDGVSAKEIQDRKDVQFFTQSYIYKVESHKNNEEEESRVEIEVDKMLGKAESNKVLNGREIAGILMLYTKSGIGCIHEENQRLLTVLGILIRKKSSLVSFGNTDPSKVAESDLTPKEIESEYSLYKITDNPRTSINSLTNFKKTTDLIRNSRIFSTMINRDEALKELEEIERDLLKEGKENYLIEDF